MDGTWYFSSQSENIHCPHCSRIEHTNGCTTHYHSALTPVVVSPGHSQWVGELEEGNGLHTLLELTDGNYRLVRSAVGARRKFFEHIRTLTTYLHFESWDHLMDFMLRGLEIGPYASLRN